MSNGFSREVIPYAGDAYNPPSEMIYASGPRSVLAGVSLEMRLSNHYSVEADMIHRPYRARITLTTMLPGGPETTVFGFSALRAWQFPVLLKYSLAPKGPVRPFVTGGVSFRTQEDVTGTEPSQVGVTAGVGVTLAWKRLRVAPTVRYTRWQADPVSYPRRATRPDQFEFLTSIGVDAGRPRWGVGGRRRLSLGALAGMGLTRGFDGGPWWQAGEQPELFRYLVGFSLEAELTRRWSVTVNAIYKPLRAKSDNPERKQAFSVLTWQFPVLAKAYFGRGGWRWFGEAGPSFRLAGNLNGYGPSALGATVGAGVERRVGPVRVMPEVRYTRWREDGRLPLTNANAVEVLAGVSF